MRIERTTKTYINRVLRKMTSQIDAEILIRVIDCLIIFFWIFRTCESHLSLVSIWRLSTWMFIFDFTTSLSILMIAIMLNLLWFLVKCMSSYLIETNTNSCRCAHFSQSRWTLFSVLQFFFVFLSYVKMFASSAYSKNLVFVSNRSHISSKSAL